MRDTLNNEYFAQFYLSCAYHALIKTLLRATTKCALNKRYALISDVRQYGTLLIIIVITVKLVLNKAMYSYFVTRT